MKRKEKENYLEDDLVYFLYIIDFECRNFARVQAKSLRCCWSTPLLYVDVPTIRATKSVGRSRFGHSSFLTRVKQVCFVKRPAGPTYYLAGKGVVRFPSQWKPTNSHLLEGTWQAFVSAIAHLIKTSGSWGLYFRTC